ncbi:hypothetical protein TKK_0000106 [Trichogramma kaykai]
MIDTTPARIVREFHDFIEYIRNFWFTQVSPRNFCVWGAATRTNNAIESYHNVLLHNLGENPPFWKWLCRIKTIMKRQYVDFETIERGRTVARQASSASYFRESTLHAVWRQLYLNEISGLELLTICSNLIGEYYRSNLNNIRPIEIDEVIDLERRFDARRLGFNQVNDPDYNFQEVVGDYRRNEALILDPNIPENQRPRWLNVPAGDVRNNQARGGRRRRNGRRRPRRHPYRRADARNVNGNARAVARLPRDPPRSRDRVQSHSDSDDEDNQHGAAARNVNDNARALARLPRDLPRSRDRVQSHSDSDDEDNLHGSESAGLNGLDQPDRGTPSLASDPVAPVESQQQGQRPATSTNEPRTSRALETVARPTGIFATLGQLYSESDSEEGFSHTDAQGISARRGHDRAELAALPEVSDSLVPIGSQQQVQASACFNNIPSAPLNNDDRVGASVAGPSSASVSREMCLLCCEEPKTHCFLSCFHYMCCEKCAEKVFKGRNNVCPNCRKKVTGVARIYE